MQDEDNMQPMYHNCLASGDNNVQTISRRMVQLMK